MRRIVLALTTVAVLAAGCGGSSRAGVSRPVTLQVMAAASLTDAFRELGAAFERAHPGTRVTFDFAGTPTLVAQIGQGAPADLLASADEPNMQKLVAAGHVAGAARVFARNQLEIVVGAGNPHRIAGLADLARPGLVLSLAAPAVPAGRYAADALARAGVALPAGVAREENVKAVVTRVALGEADAGVVYSTDLVVAGPKVGGVTIPAAQNTIARYPIAVLRGSRHQAEANAFVGFVLSPAGRAILLRHGFLAP